MVTEFMNEHNVSWPINVRKHHYTALKCISALCQRFSADNSEMISIMASDTEKMKRN